MAAQLHPEDESPFGRPFSSSDHTGGAAAAGGQRAGATSPAASASSAASPTSSTFPLPQGIRPGCLNRFDGGAEEVNGAALLPSGDGGADSSAAAAAAVVTVSADRSVRVWLLRDSGQYWPSVCHYVSAACTALDCRGSGAGRAAFVGLESGLVSEFILADDYNRMDHKRDYLAHQSRVTGVRFCEDNKWILSCGKDKCVDRCFGCFFFLHCHQ